MSRKKKLRKNIINIDPIYKSTIINAIINKILIKGKKSIAQKIIYKTMEELKKKLKEEPVDILKKALKNINITIELKSKRIGGRVFSIPTPITQIRATKICLKNLIKTAREKPGKNIILKLKNELFDAYNNIGSLIKKKEEIHKIAEKNKAFAKFKNKKTNKK